MAKSGSRDRLFRSFNVGRKAIVNRYRPTISESRNGRRSLLRHPEWPSILVLRPDGTAVTPKGSASAFVPGGGSYGRPLLFA